MLDIWGDNLYLNYPNFPYGPDSALTHILQWHPFILSKTTIVPTKTISASHTFKDVGKTLLMKMVIWSHNGMTAIIQLNVKVY